MLLAPPPPMPIQLSPPRAGAALASYGRVTAWWDHGRLTLWNGPGTRTWRAPVAPAGPGEGGDLNVGPGPDGAVWVTYMSCASGECRPTGLDLATGRVTDLGVGQGRFASLWHHRVAFFRTDRGPGRDPELIVARVFGGARGARRVKITNTPDSPTGDTTTPFHPLGLDLRGPRIAYAIAGEDWLDQQVWAGRIGAGTAVDESADGVMEGGDCETSLGSVQLTAGGTVTWLEEHDGDLCRRRGERNWLMRRVLGPRGRTVRSPAGYDEGVAVVGAGRMIGASRGGVRAWAPPRWRRAKGR
jgi:hypothetical protein